MLPFLDNCATGISNFIMGLNAFICIYSLRANILVILTGNFVSLNSG